MKKTSTYIASFIVAVLMVFAVAATILCVTAGSFASENRVNAILEDEQIIPIVRGELDKYFNDKSHTTEIPAEIYMDNLSDEYLNDVIKSRISCGFAELSGTHVIEEDMIFLTNEELEEALDGFFSDYAAKTGYVKDEKYEKKLASAKQNAYRIIDEYCDVYKFRALKQHGVLKKATPVYRRINMLTACCCAGMIVLLLMILLINRKEKGSLLYWIGTVFLVSGVICAIPCIVLLGTDYFSAFTIKQAQIFTAYTTLMTECTKSLMYTSLAAAGFGICMLAIYGIFFHVSDADSKKAESKK